MLSNIKTVVEENVSLEIGGCSMLSNIKTVVEGNVSSENV